MMFQSEEGLGVYRKVTANVSWLLPQIMTGRYCVSDMQEFHANKGTQTMVNL